jgi:Uri superfamily endonuclease
VSSLLERLPDDPGSYLLIFYLRKKVELEIGRLGTHSLRRGWYLYAGSAFGPGGLRARLKHHLSPLKRRHWHVDYLRSAVELRSIYYHTQYNNEHLWSASLAALATHHLPIPGFGSSDCRCRSHLVFAPKRLCHRTLLLVLEGPGVRHMALKS